MSEAGGGAAAAASLPRSRAGGMRAAWGSVWCLCLAAAVGALPAARRRGAERSGGQAAGKEGSDRGADGNGRSGSYE